MLDQNETTTKKQSNSHKLIKQQTFTLSQIMIVQRLIEWNERAKQLKQQQIKFFQIMMFFLNE